MYHDEKTKILNETIEIFVSESLREFEDIMAHCMHLAANAFNLDRIVIYSKAEAENDDKSYKQFYKWDKASGGTIPESALSKTLPPFPALTQWITNALKGECVMRRFDKMSKDEMDYANTFGIKSLAIVPVFTNKELWGAISFLDGKNNRDFDDCIGSLYSLAHLYASIAIREYDRQEKERTSKALEDNKRMLEILNKAAITFASQSEDSFETRIEKGVRSICDIAKLDRFSIFCNIAMPDCLHASQIYRWDREAGGVTEPNATLKNVSYTKLAPLWEETLANNKVINGPVTSMHESAMLQSFGVVSALIVPLFIKGTFWGFVLFEDRHYERYFDEEQVEIMRSAAFLCANVFIQRQMELEVAESNELNNSMLDAVPVVIVILNENGDVLNCNEAATKMFECTKQQFIENFFELSPEYQPDGSKSTERAKELANHIFTNRQNLVFEWIHASFSGKIIPCEVTITWVKHSGKYFGLVYIYDLRNIKKIEAAVTEAQEMTRAITEANPMAYVLFDENYQPIDCNEAIVKMLDGKSKQFLLDNYFTHFCPERQSYDNKNSKEEAKVLLEKTITKGKRTFEWDMQSSSGEIIPVENILTLLVLKNKKFIISFKYDLRSRRILLNNIRKQSELLASKLELQKSITEISENFILYEDINKSIELALEKLGESLNVSRMVIFNVDYENKKVYAVNQWYANENVPMIKIERFDNFTTDKLLFPIELDENSQRLMISCSNTASEPKFSMLKSMGISSFIYTPLYVEGSLWGVACAENCILTHEWTEDERTLFATVSNIMSGAIMRNVYSTRLQQSLDKVVALSKSKDDFLSKISHEIRTPMNAILGIAEIQLQNETAPQKKEALNIIHNSGKSLLHIVNDLLDLSKIEAKKMEIVPVKYEVASLINDTVQLYATRIEKKLIKFNLKVDENIPAELFGDELRIKQILNNILSNAFKYTDAGEISMSVAIEKIKDQDSDIMLIFRISDTGQGMTEEQKSRIFDEYYRFNLINNRTIGGTGLGMTIVQNLVTLMGGKISIDGEINKGSTFTISLPQKMVDSHILGKAIAENLQNFQTSNYIQAKKQNIVRNSMAYGSVLVVDDLESNLYVAKSFLEPYDLSVETVISGFEAIDKVKNGKIYDIIFMDHMMPKMDGIEAVKIIRSMGYKNPIVALTANAIVGQAEMFLENGFDAFISKPIDAKQLDAELNKYIRDKQTQTKKLDISKINAKLLSFIVKDIEKALPILESSLANIETISEDDLQLYAVTAHGIKSALANIEKTELSQKAYALEEAGRVRDKNTIKQQTQELVDALKEIIKENLCK